MEKILITGASGVLGGAIAGAARQAGFGVRQGVRNPAKANPAMESIRLDYDVPATIPPAVAGVSGLLLIAPPLDPAAPAKLAPVVESAKASGVKHVVFISAFGVNHSEQSPLRVVEHLVMDSGIPYTILRPNFFMENFSDGFLAASIKAQGAIFLAAGESKTSFISVQDVAAVGVAAFQRPLTGQEIDLTGPEALDHAEVARMIGEASGRPVAYHPLTEEQMAAGARAQGMPEPMVEYLTVLYGVVRAGYSAAVTAEVERVTGRKPIRFAEFAKSAAAAWR